MSAHLLQVMHARPRSDGDLGRGVRVVSWMTHKQHDSLSLRECFVTAIMTGRTMVISVERLPPVPRHAATPHPSHLRTQAQKLAHGLTDTNTRFGKDRSIMCG
jgi:hypothetical protein